MSKEKEVIQEPVFSPEDVLAGASHFGYSVEILAGALYGVTGSITRGEVADLVAKFMAKAVVKGE